MYLAVKLALEKTKLMLFNNAKHVISIPRCQYTLKKNRIVLCCMYVQTNPQIWILSLPIQAYLGDTFVHLWSILGKHTEGCWFTVQQSSSSSGTRVSLFGAKRQTPAHSNSSALTIYLQLGQGRVSGLFPNLPEWVWVNACLRKPAVPWALHSAIIRPVSHDSRLSWVVYLKAWQNLG